MQRRLRVPEPLLLDDGLGAGMDGREIRRVSRRSAESDSGAEALRPVARLRAPAVDEVRFVGVALSIHWRNYGTVAEGLGFRSGRTYLSSSLCVWSCDMSFRPKDLVDRLAGRGEPDGYVRMRLSFHGNRRAPR